MLTGILLALDRTPASLAARKIAIDLALKHKAAVTGILVVDPNVFAPPEPTPLGADSYKQHKDKVTLERARADAVEFAQRFTYECHEAHVHGDASVIQGAALESLKAACDIHDIVVTGFDTSFGAGEEGTPSTLIEQLLRDNPRPVIVSPKEPLDPPGARTLIAYDGSIPAMRALQIFCCSRLKHESEAVVVTVRETEDAASAVCQRAVQYLRDHRFTASARPIASPGDVADDDVAATLIEAAMSADAGLIVAGAYGHKGWREWFLGTTTQRLIARSPVPLFIHH